MEVINYFTDKKIDIIFKRLSTYIERNFISFVFKDNIILDIKHLLIDTLKDKTRIRAFYEEGISFHQMGILFIESISLFDFLRRNFIDHLPNDIDLREAKRIERLFEDIVQIFSKGYLNSYTNELIQNLEVLINYIKSRDYGETLSHITYHLEYFKEFLLSILEEKEFKNDKKYEECNLGKWIEESRKTITDDEDIYTNIKSLHRNFHNLIAIATKYLKNRLYREMLFIIMEIEANSLWLSNEISYINTKIMVLELSKDFLTGLLTRRALQQIFNKYLEIIEITGQPISIIIADIDLFKNINDTYGHLVGDAALKHFANIIRENLRKSDYVFRLGGEEFLILLPNASLEEAYKIAENLRKKLEETPLIYDGKEIKITASFGIAEFKDHNNLNNLIKEADEKLYQAKREGRNRVIA
ncbi:MAG: sensor domain-containing diguanylate cyclase [Hydrogenothermaceae bacterium]